MKNEQRAYISQNVSSRGTGILGQILATLAVVCSDWIVYYDIDFCSTFIGFRVCTCSGSGRCMKCGVETRYASATSKRNCPSIRVSKSNIQNRSSIPTSDATQTL